jgi:hypothetical protein
MAGLGQLIIDKLRLGLAPQRSRWGVHCSSVPIGSKEERDGGQAPASVPTITKRGKDGLRIMAETSLWMRFPCCLCLRARLSHSRDITISTTRDERCEMTYLPASLTLGHKCPQG